MSENLGNLPGVEKIKKYLETTFIHYTASEIYDFFNDKNIESAKSQPFTKSTIRTYLKDLANSNQIQTQDIEHKRENYYLANKNPTIQYITLKIVGLWLQHYDKTKLMNCIKEKLEDPDKRYSPSVNKHVHDGAPRNTEEIEDFLQDDDKLKNVAFFQGVDMMNYYDIPKIVGISPFRRYKGEKVPTGIQRPRLKDWINELKYGLSTKYSAMLTSSILYFNMEDIIEVEPPRKRFDGLYVWKIQVPYQEHVFDNDKTGIILDGQQRMWALDYMNLERVLIKGKEPTKFFGPVSVIIGDFKSEPEYESEINRIYFITANNTKDLPPKLQDELAGLLRSEVAKGLPTAQRSKGIIQKMIDMLENEKLSPFYRIIDHEKNRFDKNGDEIIINEQRIKQFARVGILDTVTTMLKGNPFNYNRKDPQHVIKIEDNYERWVKIIIDFFNAIKCVYFNEWQDINSMIKRNMGIYALGLLISPIWVHGLNRKTRNERVKELISYFSNWKDFDRDVEFSGDSDYHRTYQKDKKADADSLYKILQESWIESTHETELSDEVKEMIKSAETKWEEIKMDAGIVDDNFN